MAPRPRDRWSVSTWLRDHDGGENRRAHALASPALPMGMQKLVAGTFRAEQGRQGAFGAAEQSVERLKQIEKGIKNTRNIITLIGGLTSLTIIGVLWTLLQWNLQAVWKIFGLWGEKYFGLSWWLVPVIAFADFLIFFIILWLGLIFFFVSNPGQAACSIAPAMTGAFLGNGFLGTLAGTGLTWTCGVINAIKGAF